MEKLFGNFNFDALLSPDFKEDAVREVLILLIIQRLGTDSWQLKKRQQSIFK